MKKYLFSTKTDIVFKVYLNVLVESAIFHVMRRSEINFLYYRVIIGFLIFVYRRHFDVRGAPFQFPHHMQVE